MAAVLPWLVDNFDSYCDGTNGVKTANKVKFVQIIQDHAMMINSALIKISSVHVLNLYYSSNSSLSIKGMVSCTAVYRQKKYFNCSFCWYYWFPLSPFLQLLLKIGV
jgi:hypothetical protein